MILVACLTKGADPRAANTIARYHMGMRVNVFCLLVVLVVLVACGDASGEISGIEESGSSAQALVQDTLAADGWSEDDRVFCDDRGQERFGERVLGETYEYAEVAEFESREGDIFVVRQCNLTLRTNGRLDVDMRGECSEPAIRVADQSTFTFPCALFQESYSDDTPSTVVQQTWDLYIKRIGNVDYVDGGEQ